MGILSNAISGLQASQIALRTAGHNISNANTQGYTRQQVDYGTRPEQATGAGFLGSGVTTQSIERVVSEFLTTQLRADTNAYNELNAFNEKIGTIDKLMADSGTGLSATLQEFFAAMQLGADEPSSTPARQLIISRAESVAAKFNLLYGRLESTSNTVLSEVDVVISEINAIAKSIGELNLAIQRQMSLSQGGPPNDLLDKREEQLRKLSELVSIQVVQQDAGDINVMIGSGQPLVVGQVVSQLELTDGNQILLKTRTNTTNVTNLVGGGQLGGLVRFRDEMLDPTFNELGRIAIVLAEEYNRLQNHGLDLDGDFGGLFFTEINNSESQARRVIGGGNNAPPDDRVIGVEITDTSRLTIEDYTLRFIPNTQNYIVTRNSDNQEVTQGILSGAYPASIEFDGIAVHLTSGSFQGGDSFQILPTRRGAVEIESVIGRPEDLAFALPIRTDTGAGNIGAGIISAGEILGVTDIDGNTLPLFQTDGQLSPPLLIQFTSPTTYNVLDNSNPGQPQELKPPIRNKSFIPGIENQIFVSDPGATFVEGQGSSMGLPSGRVATTAVSGGAAMSNAYPVEVYTFSTTDPVTGAVTQQSLTTNFNNSAATTANLLGNIRGVSANAFTEFSLTDISINNFNSPLQIRLNGQDLISYEAGAIAQNVPNPAFDEGAFNDYLAEQINSNSSLLAQGFYAQSTTDPVTGNPELQIMASSGVDADIRLEGIVGDSFSVNDGVNPNVRLNAAGLGNESLVTIGGRIDLTLSSDVEMSTAPSNSQFFGNSNDPDFARSAYLGIQASVKGEPETDDRFNIEFNENASVDNRNALSFVGLETQVVLENSTLSLSGGYGQLVERIGTVSNLSQIDTEVSKALLQETQTARDSLSGVNLDEEAANLIRFEQMYNANARVISVSRELFDTLLNSV